MQQLSSKLGAVPSGWKFNPSEISHRVRLLPFIIFNFFIILYLMLCQLYVIGSAWDPIFKQGTDKVLHSSISRALHIPDTVLGACAYAIEIILLIIGPNDRWLNKPWLAILSGMTTIGLGAASIGLLFLQPIVVHSWCSPCLFMAITILIVLQRSISEFLACIQSAILLRRHGFKIGRWLFKGADKNTFNFLVSQEFAQFETASKWTQGTKCHWPLLTSFVLGIFILGFSDLFEIQGIPRISIEFAAINILAFSLIAMCEPLRILRFINGIMGSILFFWFLGEPMGVSRWTAGVAGLALMTLCIHRGKILGTYGLFDFLTLTLDN